MNGFSPREHAPSILVASLSVAFGVALLQATDALSQVIAANDTLGASGMVQLVLTMVAFVFLAIATYVGAVVTANTFATIIAGRTRTIALMRLIGASARAQRAAVSREGLLVGIFGAIIGMVVGTSVTVAVVTIGVAVHFMPALPYSFFEPVILVPVFGVLLTTWLASWVGSRKVLTVSPMQAISAGAASREEVARHRGRNIAASILFILGIALLLLGALVGLVNPGGVLIGVLGGMLSFTGLVLGSQLVMPPALRLVGLLLGKSAPARLAAENAVRYPERASRTTIGIVIGVTLVTMFAVATGSFQEVFAVSAGMDPEDLAEAQQPLLVVVVIFSVLIGFSALIAAVGMVNNLSLSVMQRTRELGLLRALGFTARQLRGMITAESAQLTAAAVLVGLVLGTFYGWAGAQSLLGTVTGGPAFVAPSMPLWLLGTLIGSAAVLTLVASLAPARRATRIAPVTALAVE